MGEREIVVSIINYKTADMTMDCVRSVLADLEGDPPEEAGADAPRRAPVDGHVVVVDNASGDGSDRVLAEWIEAETAARRAEGRSFPVSLVASPVNTGFSGGHNLGIGAMAARFYLVLNSDALLRPGFCATILETARAHPRAGLVAPRIEHEDGVQQTSCFRVPSPASEVIRGANTGPVTRLLKSADVPLDMPPPAGGIGWASFACILLRGEMVAELGPMDEGFFLYHEDTEYCLRARRAGWQIVYDGRPRAVHFRGGSAPVKGLARERKRLPAYYYASRSRLLYLAHGRAGLLLANLGWTAGWLLSRLRGALGRPNPNANAHEARDIWINFLTPLGDRRAPDGQ